MYKTCLCLKVALLCVAFLTVLAQDGTAQSNRLSLGVELVSTTGVGLEVATSLIPHLSLRGGISMFPISYKADPIKIPMADNMKNRMSTAMSNPATSAALLQAGLPTSVEKVNRDIDITASLGLVNGKFLVDFYPGIMSSFHFTAGLYVGKEKLISLSFPIYSPPVR